MTTRPGKQLPPTPLTIERARALAWRVVDETPTCRENGRAQGRRFDLRSACGRELVYEASADGAMYAHATTCRDEGPCRLLHSEGEVARVLSNPMAEPTWAEEARITAAGLARYLTTRLAGSVARP